MIFIKLVEVILYIVMLPLSLLSSLLPSIPRKCAKRVWYYY